MWVKTGALQWWCDWKPHKWVDVRVALEQFTGLDGARDSILFIYYVVHEEKKVCGGLPGEGGPRARPGTPAPRCSVGDRVWHRVSGWQVYGVPGCSVSEPPPHGAADSPWGFSSGT